MSLEVELNVSDYNSIMAWYTKAFGKNNDGKEQDNRTYWKIVVMAQQHLDDERFIKNMNGKE